MTSSRPKRMGARLLASLTIMLVAACSPASPEEVVTEAQQLLQKGHVEAFATHLTPESGELFLMAAAMGKRFGFLESNTFEYLSVLDVSHVELNEGSAEVTLTGRGQSDALCLLLVDGQWKIDLLAKSPCLK